MEVDDTYPNNLSRLDLHFEELDEILEPPTNMYNGEGPCLCHGVASRFDTVFGCVQLCGGLSYCFLERLAANSNQYARLNIKEDGSFAGKSWHNITVQETIHFRGVVLKMSIDNRKLGGYEAYLVGNMQINLGRMYSVSLKEKYPEQVMLWQSLA